jgi:disulfide bond formation protein DsbB
MDNFGLILSGVMAVGAGLFLVSTITLTLVWRRNPGRFPRVAQLIATEGGALFFMMSAIAVVASLIFSEIIGWEPCLLCWYQRIFYYPLPLLAGLALYRKTFAESLPYLSVLAWGGMLIALWHSALQQIPGLRDVLSGVSACSVRGPSCFDRYVELLGFMTIPLMSLMVFVGLILLLGLIRRQAQR